MKKFKKLKLSEISKILSEKDLKNVVGGSVTKCNCTYSGSVTNSVY